MILYVVLEIRVHMVSGEMEDLVHKVFNDEEAALKCKEEENQKAKIKYSTSEKGSIKCGHRSFFDIERHEISEG